MPYKNKEDRAKAAKKHYKANVEITKQRCYARRTEMQLWFQEFKIGLKCSQCCESHIACLDFHHVDDTTKKYNVGFMALKGYKKERILEEIDKCVVLCSNCHRKLHYDEKHNMDSPVVEN